VAHERHRNPAPRGLPGQEQQHLQPRRVELGDAAQPDLQASVAERPDQAVVLRGGVTGAWLGELGYVAVLGATWLGRFHSGVWREIRI